MFRSKNMRISRKLPLLFAGFCAGTSFLLIAASLIAFNRFAERSVQDQMVSLLADRSYSVRQIISNIETDLVSLSQSPATSSALVAFDEGWEALGPDAQAALQTAYITQNRHPSGEKHTVAKSAATAATSSAVKKRSTRVPPWVRQSTMSCATPSSISVEASSEFNGETIQVEAIMALASAETEAVGAWR